MRLQSPALVISHYSRLTEVNEAAIPVHHARRLTPHVLHRQPYLTAPMISLCVLANGLTDESAEARDASEAPPLTFVIFHTPAAGCSEAAASHIHHFKCQNTHEIG